MQWKLHQQQSALLPEKLAVYQEYIYEVSYVDVRNYQKVSVRVRHVDLRVTNR